MTKTVFDMILDKEIPAWIIWQDKDYMAFLTPFPNTPGLSVVIPKNNPGDYIFDLSDDSINGLVIAAKKAAKLLEKALEVKRVAMVVEGTGVAHVHVKLYPLHGDLGSKTDLVPTHQEFYPDYVGYLTTAEGPKMADTELDKLQKKIIKANES